jgi:hypothetical protein
MDKQTFKQYLESKEQLLKAIENTPVSIIEYEVRKYCTLPINETTTSVSLKPKNIIMIEWQYNDIQNPTPLSVKFKGVRDIDENEQYDIVIPRIKLQKFLSRHTTLLPNKGY